MCSGEEGGRGDDDGREGRGGGGRDGAWWRRLRKERAKFEMRGGFLEAAF